MKNNYKFLELITALYIMFQIVSDVTASKIVNIGIFTVSVTVLYFPFTYIIGDILTEVYGYVQARKVIYLVLLSSVIAGFIYSIVILIPSAISLEVNNAYFIVLGQVPRVLFGGWIAVFCGVIANNYVLAKMKILSCGKLLWARIIGSTIVGEGVNTFLFYIIALYGVISSEILLNSIVSAWFLKVMIEIFMSPLTYFVVAKLKKIENEDYYDIKTNFNPFVLR